MFESSVIGAYESLSVTMYGGARNEETRNFLKHTLLHLETRNTAITEIAGHKLHTGNDVKTRHRGRETQGL